MAHLLRLIFSLSVALVSFTSWAVITPTLEWKVGGLPFYPSKAAACAAQLAWRQSQPNGGNLTFRIQAGSDSENSGACVTEWLQDGNVLANNDSNSYVSGRAACPAHSVYNASTDTCGCDTGYTEQGGQCMTPQSGCAAKSGQAVAVGSSGAAYDYAGGKPPASIYTTPSNVCAPGGDSCQAAGTASYGGGLAGKWFVQFEALTYTGQPCTPGGGGLGNSGGGTAVPMPEAARPPAGKCPGEVNGQTVYVTCTDSVATSSSSSSSSSTGTNPDGSSANGSGSSTERSVTECSGGTCTTTTTRSGTSISESGTPANRNETSTTTQPQNDFCSKNPKDKNCSGETQGSFGGACAGGFKAVSDDAVLNAIAEETYRQNCKVNPTDDELVLANAERVKTGDQTLTNPKNSSVSLSPASFDTSDALGGGSSCIADKTITVFGSAAVSLPFSRACDSFPMLGTLLIALSFLAAAVIVLRG